MKAKGSFEVKMTALEPSELGARGKIGRMSIDKTFEGDLVGTSCGEMLSGGTPSEGSAGYVAIERVTGTLGGRKGSFQLQHSAAMTPRSQDQAIMVVPGSSTGGLKGIAGAFVILIEGGRHLYEFEYSLPS